MPKIEPHSFMALNNSGIDYEVFEIHIFCIKANFLILPIFFHLLLVTYEFSEIIDRVRSVGIVAAGLRSSCVLAPVGSTSC